ncbi:MAG: hypothetical protein AAF654_01105 [Myxococcota bacterium]
MIAILCTLLAAPPPSPSIPEGLSRLSRGDTAGRAGRYAEAMLEYKEAYDRLLPAIRGLEFRAATPTEVVKRDALKERLAKTFEEEDRAQIRFFDRALKAFGVLPPVMSLEPLMLSLLESEVAGYYDPARKQITIVDGKKAKKKKKKKKPSSFLARLLTKDGFDPGESRGVVAHELTHALTDQHYDLTKLKKAVADVDDASMALDAVIEGDAMIAMMAAMGNDYSGAEQIFASGSAYWRFTFEVLAGMAPELSGETLRSAPPFFAEAMMFPYTYGMVFLLEVGQDGGFAAVNRVYARPPESTEQVLHPERYLKRDPPILIEEPKWPMGLKRLGSNVLGEAQIRFILEDEEAAAGWGGDRYTIFEADRDTVLVWMTQWDSPDDAVEFGDAWRNYVDRRLRRNQASTPEPLAPFRNGEFLHETTARRFFVSRSGTRVVILEGPGSAIAPLLKPSITAVEQSRAAE